MKKSFLKRAIASAVAVPLALTQCLMPVLAVEVPTDIAVAADTAVTTHLTADSFTYIPANELESNWNEVFSGILAAQQDFTRPLDPSVISDFVIANAGRYKDFAARICTKLKDTKVSYTLGGGLVVKGHVDDVGNIIAEEVQQRVDAVIADVVKEYGDNVDFSPIQHIDFSSVHASADVEITVDPAAIMAGSKTANLSYKIVADDGNTYTLEGENSFINYVSDKYQEVKAAVVAANDKVFNDVRVRLDEAQVKLADAKTKLADAKTKLDEAEANGVNVDEARADYEAKKAEFADAESKLNQAEIDYKEAGGDADSKLNKILAGYDDKMDEAIKIYAKGLEKVGNVHAKGDSLEDALSKYKDEYTTKFNKKYPNAYDRLEKHLNKIPTSASDAVNKKGVKKFYNDIMASVQDMIPESVEVNIDLDELAAIFDNLYKVSIDTDDTTGTILGYMDDDQLAEVEAYYKTQGKTVKSSVKEVTVKFPTSGEGSIYYNVKRIVELEDIESTTTTTVTTTTTETTVTTVTSDSDTDTETTATTVTSDSDTDTETTVTTVTSGSETGTTATSGSDTDTETTVTTVTSESGTGTETSGSETGTTATSGSDTGTETTVTTVTSGSGTGTETSGSETGTTATSGSDTGTGTTVTTVTSGSDTGTGTTVTTVTSGSDTGTETTVYAYKVIVEDNSFYYSHDDESFSDKEGFSVVSVNDDGTETPLSADEYTLNFNTPADAFESKSHVEKWTLNDFKFEIYATVGDEESSRAIVYIGKKGDADLNNVIDSSDSSNMLTYYAALSAHKEMPLYSEADPLYESFAIFLAENNGDEIIDSSDASNVLDFYARSSAHKLNTQADIKAFWQEFLPEKTEE